MPTRMDFPRAHRVADPADQEHDCGDDGPRPVECEYSIHATGTHARRSPAGRRAGQARRMAHAPTRISVSLVSARDRPPAAIATRLAAATTSRLRRRAAAEAIWMCSSAGAPGGDRPPPEEHNLSDGEAENDEAVGRGRGEWVATGSSGPASEHCSPASRWWCAECSSWATTASGGTRTGSMTSGCGARPRRTSTAELPVLTRHVQLVSGDSCRRRSGAARPSCRVDVDVWVKSRATTRWPTRRCAHTARRWSSFSPPDFSMASTSLVGRDRRMVRGSPRFELAAGDWLTVPLRLREAERGAAIEDPARHLPTPSRRGARKRS